MTRTASKTAPAVSVEEHGVRTKLAKALWIVSVGDNKPSDPVEAQEAFDIVKNDWMLNAIKLKKTLSRLGCEVIPEK
ncbi:hypothetical protein [Pseudophaeobacter leonis]|uniref:hypothetical protein n=1 Tax=Pseudophaeobacter leonis TaxID=1144477 RepID=UPI00111BF98C|nr:hypothetical protein [Pseudophaeobacter leonis]